MKQRSGTVLAASLAALFALARPARAQVTPAAGYTPPDDTPKVSVGGTIFADYTYQSDPLVRDNANSLTHSSAFNLQRAYINVTGSISHWVSFRITPDVVRETLTTPAGSGTSLSTNGSLEYRLKYAYGQINFDDVMKGWWLRIGMQQTPIVDYQENVYRYRFQGNVFVDREGFLTSSDLGISSRFVSPGNYVEVHAGVYNGEGYNNPETNDQKAYMVRATVRPAPAMPVIKGLRLTGFYDGDHFARGAKKERIVGDLTFEHPYINAGFIYLQAKNQSTSAAPVVTNEGFSVWATPRTPFGVEALLRYDNLKPNKDVDAHKKRYIAGLAYWFPVTKSGIAAALLADFEEVKYEDFPVGDANRKPTERRLALHTLFNF